MDSLQIQSIDDLNSGYIDAMAAPHTAAIQRQAQIAQAQANQAAAQAEQESQRKQAEYARQTAIIQAQYKAEIDKAQAEASQAGPLSQAQTQIGVINAQAELAQRQAELRRAPAGRRGGIAEPRRRRGEGARPGQGGCRADADPGRGGGLERSRGAEPIIDQLPSYKEAAGRLASASTCSTVRTGSRDRQAWSARG